MGTHGLLFWEGEVEPVSVGELNVSNYLYYNEKWRQNGDANVGFLISNQND